MDRYAGEPAGGAQRHKDKRILVALAIGFQSGVLIIMMIMIIAFSFSSYFIFIFIFIFIFNFNFIFQLCELKVSLVS